MKKPDWKLGKALSVVTLVYLLCSIFGCVLYMILPPVLASLGARIHAYLLIGAALDTGDNIWPIIWTVAAHLFVLVHMVLGFYALKTGKLKGFTLMTIAEVLITFIFLIFQDYIGDGYSAGILVNLAYCAWLLKKLASRSATAKR